MIESRKLITAGTTSQQTTSGYKSPFEAINDIIDNSLDAGSTAAEVVVNLDKNDQVNSITIADNGKGIDEDLNGTWVEPGESTKDTGKDKDTGKATAGLFGSALPNALLFLGARTRINTARRGQSVQHVEFDSNAIMHRGSNSTADLEYVYQTREEVSEKDRSNFYNHIRSVFQIAGTPTTGVPDNRLQGTIVRINMLNSPEAISGSNLQNLKSNLQITYSALINEDGTISPPASADRKPMSIQFTVKKAGNTISSETLKPYFVIPSKPREEYNRSLANYSFWNNDYAPQKDTITVKGPNGEKAIFDLDISVADNPLPGKDPVLQYKAEKVRYGLATFIGGRLLRVDVKQLGDLINRSDYFSNGTTGMSRAGEHLMICLSADFSDSSVGKFRNRPFTADLVNLQSGKNDCFWSEQLLDAVAKSPAFKNMMKKIYDATKFGINLPATHQDFIKQWFDAKGETVLQNISKAVFDDEKTLKIKGEHKNNTDLLRYDEKKSTILWDFNSFAHHVGMSRDLSGGNSQMNTIKICTLLFNDLNKAGGNKFVSPIDMAQQAGAELPKARKKLFEQDYVKSE